MNDLQETKAAHLLIGHAHKMLADMDGVLIDDYHASTTAMLYRAIEIQLGGMAGIDRLVSSRDAEF
jgi:hypothetical protein